MSRVVKKLRWWHRGSVWAGTAAWIYRWIDGEWIGVHAGNNDVLGLTRDHDTANYGPYVKQPDLADWHRERLEAVRRE